MVLFYKERIELVNKLRITEDYDGYETRYPKLLELSDKKLEKQLWFASEVKVV